MPGTSLSQMVEFIFEVSMEKVIIVGGGLAGCEAAWQAAQSGIQVTLYEMRPQRMTPAHTSSFLSELVCSNSLGSNQRNRPSGLLKEECKLLRSLLVKCAEETLQVIKNSV